jgi:hypothetical protein
MFKVLNVVALNRVADCLSPPSGLVVFPGLHPRLAPWAVFFRRFCGWDLSGSAVFRFGSSLNGGVRTKQQVPHRRFAPVRNDKCEIGSNPHKLSLFLATVLNMRRILSRG